MHSWTLYPEEDGCIFFVHGHDFRTLFYIEYFMENFATSLPVCEFFNEHIDILKNSEEEFSHITLKTAAAALVVPFQHLMAHLQGLTSTSQEQFNLSHYLYPNQFRLSAQANPNDIAVQPCISDEPPVYHPPGELMNFINDRGVGVNLSAIGIKRYTSRQALIEDVQSTGTQHLLIENSLTKCFFKAMRPVDGDPCPRATLMELQKYSQIQNAILLGQLPSEVRISRLHGIIVDRVDDLPEAYKSGHPGDKLVGLLLEYIEPYNGYRTSSLQCMSDTFIKEHATCIADELEGMLKTLHNAGVIWGDVKPENILVDKDKRIWLIDFGGGYTDGWIDKDKSNTKAGDLQGLERVQRWLKREISG